MENLPLTDQTDELDSADSDKKSRKKKAGDVGARSLSAAERAERRWQRPEHPDKQLQKPPKLELLNAEPVSETEAPLEQIGEIEVPLIERHIVLVEQQAAIELPPAPDQDPAEVAADKAVEHFRSLIIAAGQDSDTAYTETLAMVVADEAAKPDTESTPANALPASPPEFKSSIFINRFAELAADDESDDPGTQSASAGDTTGASGAARLSGGQAGGTALPRGPGTPFGPTGPGSFGSSGGPGFNPSLAPVSPASAPNTAPQAPEYRGPHPASVALAGGIVGYLIGRRRGRIKTEKRLLPIQHKLEKQVADMQWQLQHKEDTIRKVAVAQARNRGAAAAEQIQQDPGTKRQQAPEAKQLHGTHHRQERIGHMLVAAEAPLAARRPQTTPEKDTEIPAKTVSLHRVETMQRAELLNISERITVGGSNLRQIYESHLVGEHGLRRLVAEHLNGGDLKKALRVEVVEREIDFERDPMLRDKPHNAAALSGSGKAALNTLLEQAAAGLPDSSEEAAFFKARARYDAAQQAQQHKQRRLVDMSVLTAIVMLIAAVALLYLRGN